MCSYVGRSSLNRKEWPGKSCILHQESSLALQFETRRGQTSNASARVTTDVSSTFDMMTAFSLMLTKYHPSTSSRPPDQISSLPFPFFLCFERHRFVPLHHSALSAATHTARHLRLNADRILSQSSGTLVIRTSRFASFTFPIPSPSTFDTRSLHIMAHCYATTLAMVALQRSVQLRTRHRRASEADFVSFSKSLILLPGEVEQIQAARPAVTTQVIAKEHLWCHPLAFDQLSTLSYTCIA